MAAEEWARQIIEKELNRPVVIHDDGSRPSMYDLRIGTAESPAVAIECVGAVDPVRTETWNAGPADGPLYLELKGDWTVTIALNACVRRLQQRIESILRNLENRDLRQVHVNYLLHRQDNQLFQLLESLGIQRATCVRMPGTGQVYLAMEGGSDPNGSDLPQWVEAFLNDPKKADVLQKLHCSKAQERWVFVPVDLGGAPWSVKSYLTREPECLPATDPSLPPPVTGIWVASTFGTHGVRWDSDGWRSFRIRKETA